MPNRVVDGEPSGWLKMPKRVVAINAQTGLKKFPDLLDPFGHVKPPHPLGTRFWLKRKSGDAQAPGGISIDRRKMRASSRRSNTSTSPKKLTRAVECTNQLIDLKNELCGRLNGKRSH